MDTNTIEVPDGAVLQSAPENTIDVPAGAELQSVGASLAVDNPPRPEDEWMQAQMDFDLAWNTGIPIEQISAMRKIPNKTAPKKSCTEKVNQLASRASDQLYNGIISSTVQGISGRDSYPARDRANELVVALEKKNGFKFTDAMYEDTVADYERQLYAKPENREDSLKGEKQFFLPKEVTSLFDPRQIDRPEGWADTGVDFVSGNLAFIASFALVKRAMPGISNPMAMEVVNIKNGGKPGAGAAMGASMEFVGGFFPKAGVVSKLSSGGAIGSVFGASTALASYNETGEVNVQETLMNFGLPVVLGYMSIGKAEWNALKPASKLELIRQARELVPELAETPTSVMEKAISDSLPDINRLMTTTKPIESKTTSQPATEQVSGETPSLGSVGVQGLNPVESGGKLVPSQTSLNTIEQAVLKGLLQENEVLPRTHQQLNLENQAVKAVKIATENPELAMDILDRKVDSPSDISPSAILKAVRENAYANGDVATVIRVSDAEIQDTGTAAGQYLVSLRGKREFDPATSVRDIREARKGIPEQELSKNLGKAQQQLEKAETKLAEKTVDSNIKAAKEPKPVKKVDEKSTTYGVKNKLVSKEMADAAWKRLGNAPLSSGIDPAKFLDVLEIATYHLEAIGRNLPEWSRILKEQLGEKVVPYLDDLWKKANEKLGQQEKDSLVEKIRTSIESGKEPSEIGKLITGLQDNLIRSGLEKREPLLDEMHKILSGIDPAITRREAMDAMSGSGKYRLLDKDEIKTIRRDINSQYQNVAKLQDMEAKKAPPKTGFERPAPSDETRQLIQKVEEAKKKGGYEVKDPEKQLKSALDEIKTRLTNRIADLKTQIQSGERIVKTKSPQPSDAETIRLTAERDRLQDEFDEIFGNRELTDQQRIAMATKSLEKSIAEYERRINENDLAPSKKRTPVSTPALEALRSRREALKDELQNLRDIANPKKTPEEIALQSYRTKLANERAKLDEKLANEDFTKPEKKVREIDAKTQKLIDDRDSAKRAVRTAQEIMEQKGGVSKDEVKNLIKLSNDIEAKKQALESEPLGKDGLPLNKESHRQKSIEYGEAMLKFSEYEQVLVPKERSWVNLAIDIAGLPQSLMTSIDFSFPFRQGWGSMATKEFWQGFWKQYSYAWDEKNFRQLQAEMRGSPRYAMAKRAGLAITNLGSDISQLGKREEGMQSTIADQIPLIGRYIRASQRAYTGMADYIRWNRFNNMVDAYTLMKPEVKWDSKQGKEVSQQLAKIINMMTGRGNIWKDDKLGNASPALNQLFFSVRKISADLNMLDPTNYMGFGKYTKLDPFVRRMAQRQLIGSLAMTSTVLGLAAMSGASIETDPTSAQFGMIHVGNRYYDISGGKISLLVFFTRMVLAQRKNTDTGEERDLTSGELEATAGRYFRSKLAPGMSLAADLVFRADYRGNPVDTPKTAALDVAKRFYPMSIGDSVSLLNDDVFGDIYANGLLDVFSIAVAVHGVGVQVHTPKDGQSNTPKPRKM